MSRRDQPVSELKTNGRQHPGSRFSDRIRKTFLGSRSKRYGSYFAAIFLVAFVVNQFAAYKIAMYFLENADFSKLNWYLPAAKWTAFFNAKITQISELLNQPSGPHTRLVVRRPDGSTQEYRFDSPAMEKPLLTPVDVYKISISLTQGDAYLYVFQTDLHYGRIQEFFPNPQFSLVSNPIHSDIIYHIPSEETAWFYLEKHADASVAATTKTVHVLISPWRAKDLEVLYDQIYGQVEGTATPRARRQELIENFIARLTLRKDAGIESIYYQELAFQHGG
ncbi:MAG: hypothetical protein JSW39_07730 [Desulfobacterales bacterium]|nr:MAG: hypothetical protein JSW39_07730 [Desulfobacterales bacterium]